jgi:putative SOS response-associated peptidase YedK
MCYTNAVKIPLKDFLIYKDQQKELSHLDKSLLMQATSRGFNYGDWPIIKPSKDGKDWSVVAMEWGFIPSWITTREDVAKFRDGYKDANGKFVIGYTTLNAKGEEILNKKMFRDATLTRRCLILSSGFYEYRHVQMIGKSGKILKTPSKFPYHITVKNTDSFMMAGIYNTFIDRTTGEVKDNFAILTTAANSLMSQVHNSKMRMPTILTDELANEWSEPDLSEKRIIEIAIHQYPAERMTAHTVAKEFLSSEDPAEPFAYETLEELV